ncbi:ATP-binding cassette domain-containing protein [Magnetospirillum aberrantis]|uniref:ATP-binding cassette domain-containing protein n=1 Tax=Magnetospirillum aberrantis SpK TaxID=908842 RepID=A0A7C9QTG7_9PROT|nr:ATP-binding cassette domain-containing protein [Magnetospirillum aberrantis SpK]
MTGPEPTTVAVDNVQVTRRAEEGKTFTLHADHVRISSANGGICTIEGATGTGKTTLLKALAGLEWIDEGSVAWRISGGDEFRLHRDCDEPTLMDIRKKRFGVAFQHSPLQPQLTVIDNLIFRLFLANDGLNKEDAANKSKEMLRNFLIASELNIFDGFCAKYPYELSGGQKQRVALAQAFVHDPNVVFADEPTASLDQATEEQVIAFFKGWSSAPGRLLIWVTHSEERGNSRLRIESRGPSASSVVMGG